MKFLLYLILIILIATKIDEHPVLAIIALVFVALSMECYLSNKNED